MFLAWVADSYNMPPPQVAKNLARVLGVLMIVLALVGFIPNSLIGTEGYFRTDAILNGVLALIGLFLLAFTTKGENTAATGLYFGAMLASVLGAVGWVGMSDYPEGAAVKLWDMVACNMQTVYLMGGTGLLMAVCGMMNTSSRQIIRD